jgi:hypothetical protein
VEHDLGVCASYSQHIKGAAASMIHACERLPRMRALPSEPGHNDAYTTITPGMAAKLAEDLRQVALLAEQAHQRLCPLFHAHQPGFREEDSRRFRAPSL